MFGSEVTGRYGRLVRTLPSRSIDTLSKFRSGTTAQVASRWMMTGLVLSASIRMARRSAVALTNRWNSQPEASQQIGQRRRSSGSRSRSRSSSRSRSRSRSSSRSSSRSRSRGSRSRSSGSSTSRRRSSSKITSGSSSRSSRSRSSRSRSRSRSSSSRLGGGG